MYQWGQSQVLHHPDHSVLKVWKQEILFATDDFAIWNFGIVLFHQDRDWFHDFTIWNRTVKRQRTAMGAWLGVGGCYEVDCTSPTLHSTKSTKSTSATVRHQSTSGSNAKVQGRWISRRRQKAEISSNCRGQDFRFFWQFANPDEKQNSRDSFDLCGNSSV